MKKILSLLLAIAMLLSLCACAGSNERDINECSSCGKKYYAGDSGGNYMNIAFSSMCKRCEKNYHDTQEILDYYNLNK